MRSFTDEDLKRIKDQMEDVSDVDLVHFLEDIRALLARLEAAEKALEIYVASEGDVIAGENVLIEWRKAAGRE